jgi:hypothetical protein
MYDIVEDHGKNQFANGQRRRDLRVSSDAAELEAQLMRALVFWAPEAI